MQCKDIPTIPILKFVEKHDGIGCNWFHFGGDMGPNERSAQHTMPDNLPDNLVLAKMRMLIKKGYLDGCPCGCRGDYEITEKGKNFIKEKS